MEWESDQALLSAVIYGLSVIKPAVQIPIILMMYLAFWQPILSPPNTSNLVTPLLIKGVCHYSLNLSIHPYHFDAESVYNLMLIYICALHWNISFVKIGLRVAA